MGNPKWVYLERRDIGMRKLDSNFRHTISGIRLYQIIKEKCPPLAPNVGHPMPCLENPEKKTKKTKGCLGVRINQSHQYGCRDS